MARELRMLDGGASEPSGEVHPAVVFRTVDYQPDMAWLVIAWDYRDPDFRAIKERVKVMEGRRYRPTTRDWVVPVTPVSVGQMESMADAFSFTLSDLVREVLRDPSEASNVRLDSDDRVVIESPYSRDLVTFIKRTWKSRKWDGHARVWRVRPVTADEWVALDQLRENFGLTISEEVGVEIEWRYQTDKAQREHAGDPDDEGVREVIDELAKDAQAVRQARLTSEEQRPPRADEDAARRAKTGWSATGALKMFE